MNDTNQKTYPQPTTWEQIEERSLHCPVLHAAVTVVRNGTASREEALMAAALFLSNERAEWIRKETDRLMNEPLSVVVSRVENS